MRGEEEEEATNNRGKTTRNECQNDITEERNFIGESCEPSGEDEVYGLHVGNEILKE